jgi:hypothetical protein
MLRACSAVIAALVPLTFTANAAQFGTTDRYRRVDTFINAFFPRIAEFAQPPHHVKWREVNLGATLPGWTRLESAEAWLNTNRPNLLAEDPSQSGSSLGLRGISSPERTSDAQVDRLFEEYLKWARVHGGTDRPRPPPTPTGARSAR